MRYCIVKFNHNSNLCFLYLFKPLLIIEDFQKIDISHFLKRKWQNILIFVDLQEFIAVLIMESREALLSGLKSFCRSFFSEIFSLIFINVSSWSSNIRSVNTYEALYFGYRKVRNKSHGLYFFLRFLVRLVYDGVL